MVLAFMTTRLASGARSPSELLFDARLIPIRRFVTGLVGLGKTCICASLLVLAIGNVAAQSPYTVEPPKAAISAPSAAAVVPPAVPANAITTATSVSAPSGYQLSANDMISVEVFGEDDLRTMGRLNAEGNVSLPLIGSVRLGGLTLTQATSRVTELYARDYLVNPKLNVSLAGYAKRRFTVLGQVNRPGTFEMPETSPGGIDLMEAIGMAGGYTRIAAPERVSVRRRAGSGSEEVVRVNAKRVERGQAGTKGFRVQPDDTITVGESIF